MATDDFLPLNAPLDPDQVTPQDNPEDNACAGDVVTVKTGLNRIGLYDEPDDGIDHVPDDKMYRGIRLHQSECGLPVTGCMDPNDITHRTLAARLRSCGIGLYDEHPTQWYPDYLKQNGFSADGGGSGDGGDTDSGGQAGVQTAADYGGDGRNGQGARQLPEDPPPPGGSNKCPVGNLPPGYKPINHHEAVDAKGNHIYCVPGPWFLGGLGVWKPNKPGS